jgi:hypothetical protein
MASVGLLGGVQHDDPLDARGQRLSFKEIARPALRCGD